PANPDPDKEQNRKDKGRQNCHPERGGSSHSWVWHQTPDIDIVRISLDSFAVRRSRKRSWLDWLPLAGGGFRQCHSALSVFVRLTSDPKCAYFSSKPGSAR